MTVSCLLHVSSQPTPSTQQRQPCTHMYMYALIVENGISMITGDPNRAPTLSIFWAAQHTQQSYTRTCPVCPDIYNTISTTSHITVVCLSSHHYSPHSHCHYAIIVT